MCITGSEMCIYIYNRIYIYLSNNRPNEMMTDSTFFGIYDRTENK